MLVKQLLNNLKKEANKADAIKMQQYMRNQFEFLGVKAPIRKHTLKEWQKIHQAEIESNIRTLVPQLYKSPYRELHYCSMELCYKVLGNKLEIQDIHLITNLITSHSWWDSVDFIAKYLLGNYLLLYPEMQSKIISEYTESQNIWLIRSTILFQLGYKSKTNESLLFKICSQQADSKNFFIKKAIGWALRTYAKQCPNQVLEFVKQTPLQNLSKKEALKHL